MVLIQLIGSSEIIERTTLDANKLLRSNKAILIKSTNSVRVVDLNTGEISEMRYLVALTCKNIKVVEWLSENEVEEISESIIKSKKTEKKADKKDKPTEETEIKEQII